MLKWMTLIMGLIALALGIVVLLEGSQEIVGIAIIAVSSIVILVGIGLLLLKKKLKTQQSTPAATEPNEEPPAF